MTYSTSSSFPQSISVTEEELQRIGHRFLASATLCSGGVVGVYLDRNCELTLTHVRGSDPVTFDPRDLEIVAGMFMDARDMIRRLMSEVA